MASNLESQLKARIELIKQRVQTALGAAADTLADNILQAGRDDISSAGKFGARWTEGFTADVAGEGTARTITLRHAVPYWRVFQYGALIQGRPLLWIPLKEGDPRASEFPGRLFRVNRKSGGVPLLMSVTDKQVKYTGHESVRIPKKFHLVEIARAQSKTLGALFKLELAGG